MSNRAFIYSTDLAGGPLGNRSFGDVLRRLGSHRGDYPIVYKLLLSGNPRICTSLAYEPREPALLGDYEVGLARLRAFLARIDIAQAQPAIQAALAFLGAPENRRQFLVLETADIVGMGEQSPKKQLRALINEINDLEPELERIRDAFKAWTAPIPAAAPPQPGLLARLFGAKPVPAPQPQEPDVMEFLGWMGLLSWDGAAGS